MAVKMIELVSIVIPSLNEGQYMGQLLKSIMNQDYENVEIIIVDGGSKDKTKIIIELYSELMRKRKYELVFLDEREFGKRRSPAHARNIGIKRAKGKYIILLDADVNFENNRAISECVELLQNYDHCSFRATVKLRNNFEKQMQDFIGVKASLEKQSNLSVPPEYFINIKGISITNSGYRREIFDNIMFNEELGYGDDLIFARNLLNLLKQNKVRLTFSKNVLINAHLVENMREFIKQCQWYAKTDYNFLEKRKEWGEKINPKFVFWKGFLNNALSGAFPIIIIIKLIRKKMPFYFFVFEWVKRLFSFKELLKFLVKKVLKTKKVNLSRN